MGKLFKAIHILTNFNEYGITFQREKKLREKNMLKKERGGKGITIILEQQIIRKM